VLASISASGQPEADEHAASATPGAAVACGPGGRVSYVEVHGLRTWHEVTGAGQPVVLLHGAFAGAASWSGQAPVLA
jgi:pimeloyl-ACP methyl ester carboxylesterase